MPGLPPAALPRVYTGVVTRSAMSPSEAAGKPAFSTFLAEATQPSVPAPTFSKETRANSRGAAEQRGRKIVAAAGMVSERGAGAGAAARTAALDAARAAQPGAEGRRLAA